MKYIFICEKGNPGHDGMAVNIDGMKIPATVKLLRNFDAKDPIGIATVKKENGCLVCEIETDEPLEGNYPAIGFTFIKREGREVKESQLHCVSVSGAPNQDETIEPINN